MQNFWRKFRSLDKTFTVIFNVVVIIFIFAGILAFANLKTNGEGFVFGYQPVYIQTGSMEPAIRTGAIILTKEVNSMDEIAIDDVITYEVYDATGKSIRITHRIYNIIDGRIITKGDNNRVADTYELSIDNVKAKTVWIWNGAADLKAMWMTTPGKILFGSIAATIILVLWLIGKGMQTLDEKYGVCKDEEGSIGDVINAANQEYEYDYDYSYDYDYDNPDGGGGEPRMMSAPIPEIPSVKKWEDIYNFKVSKDNKVTITSLKNGFSYLTEITVPDKIRHKPVVGIGPFVFKDCKATIVNLPNTLEVIEKAAFYKCEDLIYVKVPHTVKVIGSNAFDGCKELIDIELPVGLVRIEDKTFNGCVSLSSVKINDKVTFIGDSAFYGCNNLTTIYGAKAVTAIKLNAFKTTSEEPVLTNIVTENEYVKNYNWNGFGRTVEVIDSQELLEDVQAENDKFYEELQQIELDRANNKDLAERVYETVKKKSEEISEKTKKAKEAKKAKASKKAEPEKKVEPKASNMPELDLTKKEEDNTSEILEKMEKIDESLNVVKDIIETQSVENIGEGTTKQHQYGILDPDKPIEVLEIPDDKN